MKKITNLLVMISSFTMALTGCGNDTPSSDIKVTGVIGKPVISRSNRSNQLFFVNKRYVKDKTLTSAAEQGYKPAIATIECFKECRGEE